MSMQPENAQQRPQVVPTTASLLLNRLRRLRSGEIQGSLPNGEPFRIAASASGPVGELHLNAPGRLLARCALRGDVGLAEGYMAGDWDSPQLATLLQVMAENEDALDDGESRLITALELGIHRWRNRNTRRRSRRNIAAHYDLGNDFYALWLDRSMTYSAAVFDHFGQDLAAAQRAKYDALIDALGASPGEHLLEIGCGWGGFARRAAERGLRVTGVTLSAKQLAWAQQAAARDGLGERVSFRLQDYRDITGTFDHVVSIEMLEAVGEAYWPRYFDTLAQRVRPGGRVALHGITIDEAYFEGYRRHPDFIQRYIFPGGMLPTRTHLLEDSRRSGLQVRAMDALGSHYAETLARWHRRFDDVSGVIASEGFDERFRRMWRYYLAYCEAGFRCGRIDLQRLILQRPPH